MRFLTRAYETVFLALIHGYVRAVNLWCLAFRGGRGAAISMGAGGPRGALMGRPAKVLWFFIRPLARRQARRRRAAAA